MNRKRLRSKVQGVLKSSTSVRGTVIDTAPGRATVRVAGIGSKYTMIPVSFGNVNIGDTVIVDTSGVQPLVKATI